MQLAATFRENKKTKANKTGCLAPDRQVVARRNVDGALHGVQLVRIVRRAIGLLVREVLGVQDVLFRVNRHSDERHRLADAGVGQRAHLTGGRVGVVALQRAHVEAVALANQPVRQLELVAARLLVRRAVPDDKHVRVVFSLRLAYLDKLSRKHGVFFEVCGRFRGSFLGARGRSGDLARRLAAFLDGRLHVVGAHDALAVEDPRPAPQARAGAADGRQPPATRRPLPCWICRDASQSRGCPGRHDGLGCKGRRSLLQGTRS